MAQSDEVTHKAKFPGHFITFVEIFFGVVLGQSLLRFNEYLFPPMPTSLIFWALGSVYFTAITSWFGWRQTTIKHPYTNSGIGRIRSVLDAIIVALYAGLLFFASMANNSLLWYLWGFVFVFILYFAAGKLRRLEYGPAASRAPLIQRHGYIVAVAAVAYTILFKVLPHIPVGVLWMFVFLPFGTMLSFRWYREWHALPWRTGTESNMMTIAVDLDGVLVEQVKPVIEKLKEEIKGLKLCKCDIVEWEYPIGNTNIKVEIEKAEQEEEFIRQMPPIEGAVEALRQLSKKFNIVIATSRERCTDQWNRDWLDKHGLPFRLINTCSEGKSLPNVDILIDDYIGNIEGFISSGPANKRAILFAQPWNHDIRSIYDLIASGRVKIAHSWEAVLSILNTYK